MIQDTSRQSYQEEKLKGLSDRHQEILDAYAFNGPMTDRELQVFLGKADANEVRPRRFELASFEYGARIESVEKRVCSITNKTAMVWRIREVPRKQLDLFNVA